jgi:Flp pilus assembly protein TadD
MSSGYRHQGWHTQAVSAGREAVKLAPYDPHCFATLGQALSTSPSGWREAGRVIQQALELAPHDPGILSAAGHAALARKRPRLAERYFKQALAIVPDDAAIRNDLAIAHSRTFQIRHAIFGYTEALATNPNQQLSYTNIAAALYRAALVTYIVVLGCALFAANVNSRIPLILLFVLLAAWEIRGHAWQMRRRAPPARVRHAHRRRADARHPPLPTREGTWPRRAGRSALRLPHPRPGDRLPQSDGSMLTQER